MKIKKEQPTKKAGLRMSLGMKIVLIAVVIVFSAKMGINAEERFNKPIVETFNEMIGRTEFHHAGVDMNGDGVTDLFISIPYVNSSVLPFFKRLAGLLKEGVTVSFDDKEMGLSKRMGINVVEYSGILEINGRSVLLIFPGEQADFPLEAARQERLKREAATAPASPTPATQETAEERRIRELEEELRRLREGR